MHSAEEVLHLLDLLDEHTGDELESELTNEGLVIQVGRGQSARWHLKQSAGPA